MCANSARHRRIAHEAQIACHARRELLLRSLLILHSQLVSTHRGPGQSPDLKCSANTARCSKHGAQRSRETQTNNCGASPTRRTCPAARRRTCWHWCFGEEDLHATDVGGMSNASAIGVRGLCDRGACRVRRPPDPARARGGRAAPWLAPAGLSSRRNWGLADRGRSRSAARKTYHAHGLRTGRAMRRERRAADAPCGSLSFLKRPRRGPAAGQPVLLRGEPLFVGRMLGRDRGVSCRDGTLHLLLRRSLWHRGPELPSQKHSLVGRSKTPPTWEIFMLDNTAAATLHVGA